MKHLFHNFPCVGRPDGSSCPTQTDRFLLQLTLDSVSDITWQAREEKKRKEGSGLSLPPTFVSTVSIAPRLKLFFLERKTNFYGRREQRKTKKVKRCLVDA